MSMAVTGFIVSPAAAGSTRKSVTPSGVRAGTSRTSATWAHATNCLAPLSRQPAPTFSARVAVDCGSHARSASTNAVVARAPPVAMAGSHRFFCSVVPALSTAWAASTVGRYGPG